MTKFNWSPWYPLTPQSLPANVPGQPGIYEIRTDYEFGRLRGRSRVVYVGSAARGSKPSLKVRLIDQRIGNPERYLSGAEKLLREAGHALEFRFVTTLDGTTAKRMEAQRLTEYEVKHWELPPGNSVLPRNIQIN